MRIPLLAATLAALLAVPTNAQSPVVSSPEDREAVSLTVYNGGFAVVREVRPLMVQRGVTVLRFEGVPQQIDPTSLALKSLTTPGGLSVLEQNYQYNLIGTNSVLDAAVGQRVRIIREMGERTVVDEGTLISQPNQGRIIRTDDGRVLVNPGGTIELLTLPEGLLSRPSLLWRLNSERGGEQRVEASYMTNGISWKADYVAVVNEAETEVDVTGWVTVNNQSGASYPNAGLQLIAGDVRRVQNYGRPQAMYDGIEVMQQTRAAAAPPEQEAFFEYHLYTFPTPTTIEENETKQLELLSADEVGVERRLIFDGAGTYFPFYRPRRQGPGAVGDEMSAAVVLEMENAEANNMGMPLPAGTVRVYKADRRGNLQFLGEDRIAHTPRNETVRLYIGDAFDVVGTRRQMTDRRINDRTREFTIEVEVRNRKEEAATVDVVERVFWGDWSILESTHEHERLDATTAQFTLELAANETATIRYTARVRY
ncbi:MAG: DUF4139 domain-containing protein [Bacteroidota bacterium]